MEPQSVSLKEIIKYKYPDEVDRRHQGYLITRIDSKERHATMFFDPVRIDAIAFIICLEGSFEFNCNLKEYKVEAGSLLMLPPKCLISGRNRSKDYAGYIAILDTEYLSECNFNIGRFTSLMVQVVDDICVKLTEQEQQRLMQYIGMIGTMLAEPVHSMFREDVIRSMIETLTYLFCEIFSLHTRNEESGGISRQENYFRLFIKELSEHYAERQVVGYYADKLCISARYLTTIVRRVSGLTVSDWMNKYLIMEAKYLLKYNDLSIQEVAYRLSFPDQSFFGKYFKQHVGVSPSHYRNHQ